MYATIQGKKDTVNHLSPVGMKELPLLEKYTTVKWESLVGKISKPIIETDVTHSKFHVPQKTAFYQSKLEWDGN